MNRIAEELDAKLQTLDPERAKSLESLVRDAMVRVERGDSTGGNGWPDGYFEQTSGALAGERFERPTQGETPRRDQW